VEWRVGKRREGKGREGRIEKGRRLKGKGRAEGLRHVMAVRGDGHPPGSNRLYWYRQNNEKKMENTQKVSQRQTNRLTHGNLA